MKTLQEQYNEILKGKGHKDVFLKEANKLFPNIISKNFSFNQAINELKRRNIISEIKKVSPKKEKDFFKIFKESLEQDIKADAKKTHKSVEDMELAGFDFRDLENIDNVFGQQFLVGFMAEMGDPKNHNKTIEELKVLVAKNLKNDRLYYIKNGAFGIKGVGYEEMPATKDITAKTWRSSGMEKTPLNESQDPRIQRAMEDIVTYHTLPPQIDYTLPYKKKADQAKQYLESIRGGKRYIRQAYKQIESYWTEPVFDDGTTIAAADAMFESKFKIKNLLKEKKKFDGAFKSALEKITTDVFTEKDFNKAREILTNFIKDSKINDHSKKDMLHKISLLKNKFQLDKYVANALLKYEKLGVNEQINEEGFGFHRYDSEHKAIAVAKKISREEGVAQHVNEKGNYYEVSDWYDDDTTIASFEDGRPLNENQSELPLYKPRRPSPETINALEIEELEREIEEVRLEMEQEAEAEGGDLADVYGELLNKLENDLRKLRGEKPIYENLEDNDDDWNKPDPDDIDIEDLEPKIDAYNEGFDIQQKGGSLRDNPYARNTSNYNKWRRGWEDSYHLGTVDLLTSYEDDDDLIFEENEHDWVENELDFLPDEDDHTREPDSESTGGLYVKPDSDHDLQKLEAWLESSDFYAEYDMVTKEFFFPEAPESYDELEMTLTEEFEALGINVTFEGLHADEGDLPIMESHTENPDMPGYELVEAIAEEYGKGSHEYNTIEDIISQNISDNNKITQEGIEKIYSYISGIGAMNIEEIEETLYQLTMDTEYE